MHLKSEVHQRISLIQHKMSQREVKVDEQHEENRAVEAQDDADGQDQLSDWDDDESDCGTKDGPVRRPSYKARPANFFSANVGKRNIIVTGLAEHKKTAQLS